MKIVKVEWYDAESDDGWHEADAPGNYKLPVCVSIGILAAINKQVVVLAMTHAANPRERWNILFAIPRGCVKKIKILQELK